MKPNFIPPEARPPVNQELAREAWEVAAVLESVARRRESGEITEKETSNDKPNDQPA